MSNPNSVADFFAMGGYAAYVWPAYAIAIAIIAGMAIRTHLQWRRWSDRVRTLERSNARDGAE